MGGGVFRFSGLNIDVCNGGVSRLFFYWRIFSEYVYVLGVLGFVLGIGI